MDAPITAAANWTAERAHIHTILDICGRLVDNPTDPEAQAAARQMITENPQWVPPPSLAARPRSRTR